MSVSLAAKPGSRERLKVRSRCGCSLCARQMRCTEPTEMPMALAIVRLVQWVPWCGGSAQVNPHLGKALLPSPYRRPAAPETLRYPLRRMPIRRGEHDPRPLDMLAWAVAVGRDCCQLLTLRRAHNHTDVLRHDPPSPQPWPRMQHP